MSNSPTARTSTTSSSTNSPSPLDAFGLPRARVALIACGALGEPAAHLAEARQWPIDVHPLPPLLHNQPARIAGEVAALAGRLRERYAEIAVGYADCGTYGALDEVCRELGLRRLKGLHCYDV